MRVLAPTGVLGSGFVETSFEAALARQPHFIGCDAGSTDPGPSHLGSGNPAFPRAAVKRDLKLMLRGARRLDIPLLVGSAGTAGADAHLAWTFDILKEIASEEKLAFRLALIHAEQDKAYLKRRLREGRIKPLHPAPAFDEQVIERAERFVGMMGAEPFTRALEAGAEVVIAGRSSDTAIFAALPVLRGFPGGLAWHAAKILECGAAAVVERKTPDCITVKLEGAEKVGYQSVVIGSVRDPYIVRQIDDWTARLQERIHGRVAQVYGGALKQDQYHIHIRVYGKNGTMGALEPVKEIRSHELALLIDATAPTQELASSIAGVIRHQALHLPVPEWSGLITALACPYNPAHLDRGAVYRFNVNHVVEPDDPYEMFPMDLLRVDGASVSALETVSKTT